MIIYARPALFTCSRHQQRSQSQVIPVNMVCHHGHERGHAVGSPPSSQHLAPGLSNAAPSSMPASVATCSPWSTVRGDAAAARRWYASARRGVGVVDGQRALRRVSGRPRTLLRRSGPRRAPPRHAPFADTDSSPYRRFGPTVRAKRPDFRVRTPRQLTTGTYLCDNVTHRTLLGVRIGARHTHLAGRNSCRHYSWWRWH